MYNYSVTNGTGQMRDKKMSKEEFEERQIIAKLEQIDRDRYIADIVNLMRDFQGHGISADVSAQLAGNFYSDPEIRKRRANRRKKK